jgi:hypothetical protein
MTTTQEEIIMAHKLTPARQNALLGKCSWEPDSRRVRVLATHHTEPLLRLAGIDRPRALEHYLIPVCRDASGFLVIDMDARAEPASHGELFDQGGIFAGMPQEENPEDFCGLPQLTEAQRQQIDGSLSETRAILAGRGRRFEVATGPTSKVRILVIALDDQSLPSPGERERWEARDPNDTDVIAAAHALALAKDLTHYER